MTKEHEVALALRGVVQTESLQIHKLGRHGYVTVAQCPHCKRNRMMSPEELVAHKNQVHSCCCYACGEMFLVTHLKDE